MPDFQIGVCPVCNAQLQKKTVERIAIVPDGAADAVWTGPGEVMRRTKAFATTINNVREIAQKLYVWEGGFSSPWAPFCTVSCAGQFGLDAWAAGYTGGALKALPAPTAGKEIAEGFQRLLSEARGEAPAPEPEPPRLLEGFRTTLRPGDPGWHPPGKPPPVPGEFHYGPKGRRVSETPAAQAMQYAKLEGARAARHVRASDDTPPAPGRNPFSDPAAIVPPPPPEIAKAIREDAGGITPKLTRAREIRFRQLWPDLRFGMKVIVHELNQLPGPPYTGATSMSAVAAQLGLPTRRIEAYSGEAIRHGRVIDHEP